MSIIKEYRCENKICYFTFDNALVNKTIIDKLSRILNPNSGGILFMSFVFVM